MTVLHPSGAERCGGCGRVVQIDALIAPRALTAQQEEARLTRLAKAAKRGDKDRRYAFTTLRELELEGRPWPESIGPLRAEVERARDRLLADRDDERERRYWELALVRATAENVLSRDAKKRVKVLEEALEYVEDAGRRDVICCHLARAHAELGAMNEATEWLARTDPTTPVLEVHTERTATRASLALRAGDAEAALTLVGERDGDVPLASATAMLAAQLRVAALEQLGRDTDADDALAFACRSWGQHLILSWMRENDLAPHAVERFLAASGT